MERFGAEEGYTANFKSSQQPPARPLLSKLKSASISSENVSQSRHFDRIRNQPGKMLLAVCRVRAGCLCYHVNSDIL